MCGVLDHQEFTLAQLRRAIEAAGLKAHFEHRQVEDQTDENFLKHDMLDALTKRTEADILRAAVRHRIKVASDYQAPTALSAEVERALSEPSHTGAILDFAVGVTTNQA